MTRKGHNKNVTIHVFGQCDSMYHILMLSKLNFYVFLN